MRITQLLKIGGIFVGGVMAAAISTGYQQSLNASSDSALENISATPSEISLSLAPEPETVWLSEDMKYGFSAQPYSQNELGQQFILTNMHSSPMSAVFAFPNSDIDGQENEKWIYDQLVWPEESTLVTFENSWQSCTYDFIVFYADMTISEDNQVNVCN